MVIIARDTDIKTGYKLTEVGVIPEDWEVKSIGESFEICNYLRYPISQNIREKMVGQYPYYGPTKAQDYLNEYRVEGEYALIGEDGDHFLKWQDSPMTLLVSGKFNVNNHAHLVKGNKNLISWFYYYFQHKDLTLYLTRQGAGRYKLTKNTLITILCPIPPLPEQQAIATALCDIDALITSLDKLIAKKRDIKQAVMQQLLTGKMRLPGFSGHGSAKLGDFFELNPSRTRLKDSDLVTFIGMEDVSESGCMINQNILSLSSVKKGLTFFERDDILVAKITPCFENGKGACLDTLKTKVGFGSTEFHVLRAKKNADPRYVFYQTQTAEFRKRLETEMIGTAGQKRVPAQAIINYSLPVLHLKDEQTAIATILSDMDAEITALEQKRDKTRALKHGMMQELLTGKKRLL
jgi:type I restriction enzyme S subunit